MISKTRCTINNIYNQPVYMWLISKCYACNGFSFKYSKLPLQNPPKYSTKKSTNHNPALSFD